MPDINAEAALEHVKRRLGLAEESVYVREIQAMMDGEAPPDHVVLVMARLLPGPMRHWVRAKLYATPEWYGEIETRSVSASICSGYTYSEVDPPVNAMIVHTAEVGSAQCEQIMELIRAAKPEELTSVRTDRRVIDGTPCTLIVAPRTARQMTRVAFNLGDVKSAALLNQPAVRLVKTILSLRSRVDGQIH